MEAAATRSHCRSRRGSFTPNALSYDWKKQMKYFKCDSVSSFRVLSNGIKYVTIGRREHKIQALVSSDPMLPSIEKNSFRPLLDTIIRFDTRYSHTRRIEYRISKKASVPSLSILDIFLTEVSSIEANPRFFDTTVLSRYRGIEKSPLNTTFSTLSWDTTP